MAEPTTILAIETTNPGHAGAGVALGRLGAGGGVELLGEESLRAEARHDDALVPTIARMMERLGVSASELGRVAVSVGPGGYTSMRIGVTVAKMVCEATGARCVPVSTAESLHLAVDERVSRKRGVVVCLAWKRESVWRAVSAPGGAMGEGRVVALDDVLSGVGDDAVLIAEETLVGMLRQRWMARGDIHIEAPVFSAARVMELGARGVAIDPLELLPLYPREPEAVTKWRQRSRG